MDDGDFEITWQSLELNINHWFHMQVDFFFFFLRYYDTIPQSGRSDEHGERRIGIWTPHACIVQ